MRLKPYSRVSATHHQHQKIFLQDESSAEEKTSEIIFHLPATPAA
jgi:hypothetical protein